MEHDSSKRDRNEHATDQNTEKQGHARRSDNNDRDSRPRYSQDRTDRTDRPFRKDRPSFRDNKEGRSFKDRGDNDRNRYSAGRDNDGGERKPRFERDGERRRPRPDFAHRDRKPRFTSGDRDRRPNFENRSGDERPRDDRPRDGGFRDRPRDGGFRDRPRDGGFRDRPRDDRPRDGGFRDRPRDDRFRDKERSFEPRDRDGVRPSRPRSDFGRPSRDQDSRFAPARRDNQGPREDFRKDRPFRDGPRREGNFRDKESRGGQEWDRERRPRPDFKDRERRPYAGRGEFNDRNREGGRDGYRRDARQGGYQDRSEQRSYERRPRQDRFEERSEEFTRPDRMPENQQDFSQQSAHNDATSTAPLSQEGQREVSLRQQEFGHDLETGYTQFGFGYSNTTVDGLGGAEHMGDEHAGERGQGERPAHGEGQEGAYARGDDQRPYRHREGRDDREGRPRFDRDDRPRFDRGDRDGRPRFDREDGDRKRPMKRPPLRETIMDMDKDMLKMLARRCNILDRMRSKAGQMAPKEEKELRASWEKAATQMTRDTRIIHQLFALMQEVTFSAKPEAGQAKRTGFNLAPPQLPVDISLFAPLASRRSRMFLALAGASGSACSITPSLLDDATIECIKMFNQCATSLAWDDAGTLISRQGGGLSLPDKVIYVGDDIFNFFLLLGHYVSKNTRAKFTGEASLKEADLTAVRSFLPQLGARLSNVMPNGSGFPVRVECSGIFSDCITIPTDIPADMVTGLFLAAPFWETAISFEMRAREDADAIIEEVLSVLTPSGAQVRREGSLIHFAPCPIKTPQEPSLGMDLALAAYLLALPLTVGGKVQLQGQWPDCPAAQEIQDLLTHFGLEIDVTAQGISTQHEPLVPIKHVIVEPVEADEEAMEIMATDEADAEVSVESTDAEPTETAEVTETAEAVEEMATEAVEEEVVEEEEAPEVLEDFVVPNLAIYNDMRFAPLMATCAYLAAIRKKRVILPGEAPLLAMESFFNHLGFDYAVDEETQVCALERSDEYRDPQAVWTAPTPAWALAYAVCAAARPHIKLSNPGIMGSLYPQFWTLYNALPSFDIKKNVTENTHDKPVRRRIIAADQEGIGSGDSPNRDDA